MADSSGILQEHRDRHTRQAILRRLDQGPSHSYLRDWIYGAIDGAVTTFAVVCGVAGADLTAGIVIILGTANLLADGFSMAVSNFLGTRAEQQQRETTRRAEEVEVRVFPEGEREEIRQIFARKGFMGADLEQAVKIITSDVERWVQTMLVEEHGITVQSVCPWRAAGRTFVAFVLIGALPLLPYFFAAARDGAPRVFLSSAIMTGVALFIVGAFTSRYVTRSWIRAGLETLVVGGLAASIAYAAGVLLKGMVG